MKKLALFIALTAAYFTASAQTWQQVGNTLQRQTNGTYSNYRFNMGSPGFFSLYSKAQTDSLVSIITGGYLKWSDTTNSIQTIQNLNPRIAAFGDSRYLKTTGTGQSINQGVTFLGDIQISETILPNGKNIEFPASNGYAALLRATTGAPGSSYAVYMPPSTGTLALTSDIPSLTNYVKYTGATADLDLVSTGKGLYSEFIEAGHAGGTGAGLLASYFYNDNLTGRGIGIAAGDATHEALYIQPYNLGAKTIQLFGDGHATFTGAITTPTIISGNIQNATSSDNSQILLTTNGTTISRNIADAAPTLTVNNLNPSSTGDIIDFAFTGIVKASIDNTGIIKGSQFKTYGGTSSQFLKADGSVDNSTYLTSSSASSLYLALHGTADNSTAWNGYSHDMNTTAGTSLASTGYILGVPNGSSTVSKFTQSAIQTFLGLGSNAYTSTAYLPTSGFTTSAINTLYGYTPANGANYLGLHATADAATLWGTREADFNSVVSSVLRLTAVDNSDGKIKQANLADVKTWLGLGSNAYTSTAYLPQAGGTLTGNLTAPSGHFTDGTQGLILQAYTGAGGFGAIYPYGVTPNNTNYSFASNVSTSTINGSTSTTMAVNGSAVLSASSTGVNVTGTGTFNGSILITGSDDVPLNFTASANSSYWRVKPSGGDFFIQSSSDNSTFNGVFSLSKTGNLTLTGAVTAPNLPIHGNSTTTGSSTTIVVVNIGQTMANTNYIASISPQNSLTAVNWYVSAKTTTTFTITFVSAITGSIEFDWSVIP